jgi:hypothetical protein
LSFILQYLNPRPWDQQRVPNPLQNVLEWFAKLILLLVHHTTRSRCKFIRVLQHHASSPGLTTYLCHKKMMLFHFCFYYSILHTILSCHVHLSYIYVNWQILCTTVSTMVLWEIKNLEFYKRTLQYNTNTLLSIKTTIASCTLKILYLYIFLFDLNDTFMWNPL